MHAGRIHTGPATFKGQISRPKGRSQCVLVKIWRSTWNTYLVWRLNAVVKINRRYKTFVGTLHCELENGADLYVNERQKIGQYRARSTEERKRRKKEEKELRRRMPNRDFFTSRSAYVNCSIIAMLYTHSIGNQP